MEREDREWNQHMQQARTEPATLWKQLMYRQHVPQHRQSKQKVTDTMDLIYNIIRSVVLWNKSLVLWAFVSFANGASQGNHTKRFSRKLEIKPESHKWDWKS